jgi:hypothetical protein
LAVEMTTMAVLGEEMNPSDPVSAPAALEHFI